MSHPAFSLIREAHIPEISSTVRHYRHIKTGAELISAINDDDNKSFGVAFQTPAFDDTGLPHILEHSVLAGSRKYQVKEPFVELIKTSLNTFVNAMTFPDMTIYPVASANLQDFYNLIEVYLDAVFYPLLTEQVFMQEGWHYEAESLDAPLTFKGVVFNEMKGYFSSPEVVLQDETKAYLMPDTPYANNSGGNPSKIPDLTYQQFKDYHATYYHPSNARFFFYGDDDPAERLRLVDAFIDGFSHQAIDATLPLQPRWDVPRDVVVAVDAGDADATSNKALMTVNWLLSEITNIRELNGLAILNHILIGTPASPLTVALLDSGLGEDLAGGGLDTYAREASFSIGMKGIVAADAPQIQELILDTLAALADDGIDPDTIRASLNTIEFDLREKNTGRFPRGLAAFIGILPIWLHGGDPVEAMAFEEQLSEVKQAYAENPQFFEGLIGQYFLQNNHRVTITLQPDPSVKPAREAAEIERLATMRDQLDATQLEKIIEDAALLHIAQGKPDDPAELAKLPTLTLGDLDRNIRIIPTEQLVSAGAPLLYHEIGTSGVVYLDLFFSMKGITREQVPYMGLFTKALTEIGTDTEDFIRLQNRIGAATGGIDFTALATLKADRSDTVMGVLVRAKSMTDQTQEMLDILSDILLTVNFDDKERFRQMVLEEKAQMEAYLGMIGHVLDSSRLAAKFSVIGWFGEQNGGVTQLFFVRELAERLDRDWDTIVATLNAIRAAIVNRATVVANVTLDREPFVAFAPQLEAFLNRLPHQPVVISDWGYVPDQQDEAFAVTTQVNFVGKAANLYDLGYTQHGSTTVILKHFNLTYLWTKIRVQGGAYGGRFGFDVTTGIGTFLSWQDPNIVPTLNNYDGSAEFLRTFEMTPEELEKAIIGAVGHVDAYLLPDAKGMAALMLWLTERSEALRQQTRDELFATTLEDFRAFADVMAKVAQQGIVVVTGSAEKLAEANSQLNGKLRILQLQ